MRALAHLLCRVLGLVLLLAGGPVVRTVLLSAPRLSGVVWSPDGAWLLFTSNRGGGAQVYRLHLASDTLEQLTRRDYWHFASAWSPDGRYITFDREMQGATDIYKHSLVDGSETRLTHSRGSGFSTWMPPSQLAGSAWGVLVVGLALLGVRLRRHV